MVNGDRRCLLFSDPSSMGSSAGCGVRRFNFYLGMQIAERAGKENIKDPRQKWKRSEKSADSKLLLIALNIIVCLVMIKAQAREVERRKSLLLTTLVYSSDQLVAVVSFYRLDWRSFRLLGLYKLSHLYGQPRNVDNSRNLDNLPISLYSEAWCLPT